MLKKTIGDTFCNPAALPDYPQPNVKKCMIMPDFTSGKYGADNAASDTIEAFRVRLRITGAPPGIPRVCSTLPHLVKASLSQTGNFEAGLI